MQAQNSASKRVKHGLTIEEKLSSSEVGGRAGMEKGLENMGLENMGLENRGLENRIVKQRWLRLR